jgi:hypothetical protein
MRAAERIFTSIAQTKVSPNGLLAVICSLVAMGVLIQELVTA